MSLDVYLSSVKLVTKTCPHCGSEYKETEELFNLNITHNLGEMADQAGLYLCLWEPGKIDITCAAELIEPLKGGLRLLKKDPDHFKQFNPENGWGNYENLVEFVEKYLQACEENPNAQITVSR